MNQPVPAQSETPLSIRALAERTVPTAGQAGPPSIPDYELLRRIGGGSYGDVWLARSATGALRAVKIVWRHTFDDDRPFQREFEGIQNFERLSREHPSQLALYHVSRGEGYFFYVMELADDAGKNPKSEIRNPKETRSPKPETDASSAAVRPSDFGLPSDLGLRSSDFYQPHTLRADLAQGRLPAARVLEIGLALTEAMAHLHKNGLVHRDVKPSNIIFVHGRPKLADIGLVTDAGDARSIVGTEGYLAAEGPGTPQADLFALGKVLYEAATGLDRRQFPQLPPGLRAWPDAALVFELNEILLRASAAAVRERYQSAEEMRAELALLQAGKSVKHQRAWRRSLSHAKKATFAIGSLAIASAIVFSLPIWKSGPPAIEWSKNEAANDAFRNGSLFMDTGSGEAFSQAARFFERAIALDPKFARAYAGLAGAYGWAEPGGSQMLEKSRSMAEKALSLNEKLDGAHAALGWPKAVLERDWPGAEKEYRRALQLNPSSGKNLYGLANILVLQGRTNEAVQRVEKALRMDSLSVLSLQNAGWVFSAARQYERAIQKFEELIDKEPSSLKRMADLLAVALRERGHYLKAIQIEEEAALLRGENPDQVKAKYDALREAWRRGGAKGYWQQVLDEHKNDESNPVWLAALYARVGEKDKAFHYLNVAFEKTPTELTFEINREPAFDGLRSDPRFAEVLKKLHLGR